MLTMFVFNWLHPRV